MEKEKEEKEEEKEEKEKEKIPHMCESIGYRPLRGRGPNKTKNSLLNPHQVLCKCVVMKKSM